MTCIRMQRADWQFPKSGHSTPAEVGIMQGLQAKSKSQCLLHCSHPTGTAGWDPTSALLVATESPSLAEAMPGGCALISSDTLQRCKN